MSFVGEDPDINKTNMTIEGKQKVENFYDGFCKLFFPLIPEWIKPNHLTIVRLIGIPFMVYLLWQGFHLGSLVLFACLALTDMFDGALARGRNQITDLGTLLDPIADKLLIASAVIVLLLKVNFYLAIILVGLDALVILMGIIVHLTGIKLSFKANMFGKIKLNLQVFGIGFIFLGLIFIFPWALLVGQWLLYGAVLFAMLSLLRLGA